MFVAARRVYPSGDSPQATAVARLRRRFRECIRAAIPHKPQRGQARISHCSSVSERRFPTSHSAITNAYIATVSVSERRFPTSHSMSRTRSLRILVYPSGDSPQATAKLARANVQVECIRAAIPHKPQRVCVARASLAKCIRAAIPHKPQLDSRLGCRTS